MVCIPLFGEQEYTVGRAVQLGIAVQVGVADSDFSSKLLAAINRVLDDTLVRAAVQELSATMRARRWAPAELAASES